MKNNEPGNHDDALRNVLTEWRTDASLPPRFQEAVWRRIEQAERTPATTSTPSVWAVVANWIETVLPRPAIAASCLVVLLAIGAATGWAQARHKTNRVGDQLSVSYIRSVDPYRPNS
jgi:anti-sigma-K factor RskA